MPVINTKSTEGSNEQCNATGKFQNQLNNAEFLLTLTFIIIIINYNIH